MLGRGRRRDIIILYFLLDFPGTPAEAAFACDPFCLLEVMLEQARLFLLWQ